MSVTINEVGARLYLVGNTYPIKDAIKAAGGHWDSDRKQWWIGKAKRAEIEETISKMAGTTSTAGNGERPKETADDKTPVRGKVAYKGRTYYLIAESRDGNSYKVCTLDGQIVFWARRDSGAQVVKRYFPREFYGRQEYQTLGGIRRFIEGRKANPDDPRYMTREEKEEAVQALEDMDNFDGAAFMARQLGIPY